MALISVLVGAYRAAYLDAALRSALDQTHRDLEVVVVDDSPGAEVHGVVRALDDSRIRYFRNERNLGPAATYQRALDESTGDVVGILNDDDLWEPDLARTLLRSLESSEDAVVAFGDHWILVDGEKAVDASDASSRLWKRDALEAGLHRPFQRLALVDKAIPIAVAALFRKSAVLGSAIPAAAGGTYDYFLAYVLSRDGGGAVYVPERLASWRTHGGNLTGVASPNRAEEGAVVLRVALADPRLAAIHPSLRAAYRAALWTIATRNLRGGSRKRAVEASLMALRQGHAKSALLLPLALAPRRMLPQGKGRSRA